MSIIPQSVDGVEVCRLPGGEIAEYNTDSGGDAEGDSHRRQTGADGNGGIRHQRCNDRGGSGREGIA